MLIEPNVLNIHCHCTHDTSFPKRWCYVWPVLFSLPAAFPLGSKKCRVHCPTLLLRPQTLFGNAQLQPAKDWAFPPALPTGQRQGPQKHTTQQGQVTFSKARLCPKKHNLFISFESDHKLMYSVCGTRGAELVLGFLGINQYICNKIRTHLG